MRLVDWYLGLGLGQKIVVGGAVAALVLVGSYLASLLILSVAAVMSADSPPQEGATPAPKSPRPGASASASASASAPSTPAIALKIERARWEGDKAVVEGTWRWELSSVHCDLMEGGKAERAIDWWDRSVAAEQSFSDRTFSQEFVRAKGRVKDRIDPESAYKAVCSAQFSDGWSVSDEALMEGKPPG